MSLSLVKTTNKFTPDMIDDVVEVLAYDPDTGNTGTYGGTLAVYSQVPQGTAFVLQGFPESTIIGSDVRLTINHYEWDGLSLEEIDS